MIVTKDSDFSAWALLAEPPPRVVHFRIGNLRLRDFAALVERIWPTIDQLVVDHRLIIVRTDAIEGVV